MTYRDAVHTKVMDKIYLGSDRISLTLYPLRMARAFMIAGGEYEGEIEKAISVIGHVHTSDNHGHLVVVRYTRAS